MLRVFLVWDLEFDAVFQRAGPEGKTTTETDKKIISYNLCLKGHLIGCFPSCPSAAQKKWFCALFQFGDSEKNTALSLPSPII